MKKNKKKASGEAFSMLSKQAIGMLLLILAIVLVVVGIGRSVAESTAISVGERESLTLSPTQIQSVEAIGEWEFLSIEDEELVDTTRNNFFRDDKLVRIYYGTLRLGINTHHLEHGWAETKGDTLLVRMPAIELLDKHFIDEARTQSFYEEGKWSHADRERLYRKAEQMMRERCLTADNFQKARENAEEQLRKLFQAMGFEQVIIVQSSE